MYVSPEVTNIGVLFRKLFWCTVKKNCHTDGEKFLKLKAEGREFAKFLRLLEQFICTEKGQYNFWNRMRFKTCFWRFLTYNTLKQLYFNLKKKLLGFRTLHEKLEKYWIYCHDIDRAWIPKPGNSTLKKILRFSYDTLPSNGEIAKKKRGTKVGPPRFVC